jgi:hypothetical protein
MFKQILFIGAAAVSLPAVAQDNAASLGNNNSLAPTEQVAKPAPNQPVTDPAPMEPASADEATSAAGTPATATQVAAIVEQEFAAHDSDGNGELNAAEFTAWMTKLRAAAPQQGDNVDPATWSAQAFKVADADSSSSVSKAELVNFLNR